MIIFAVKTILKATNAIWFQRYHPESFVSKTCMSYKGLVSIESVYPENKFLSMSLAEINMNKGSLVLSFCEDPVICHCWNIF